MSWFLKAIDRRIASATEEDNEEERDELLVLRHNVEAAGGKDALADRLMVQALKAGAMRRQAEDIAVNSFLL